MAEAGVAYTLHNLFEGAVVLAKGVYDPTLPLEATLSSIDDVDIPQAFHTVTVVKGLELAALVLGLLTCSCLP